MNNLTIAFICLPLSIGFLLYLLPKFDKYFALFTCLISTFYSSLLFIHNESLSLQLLDNFGVVLKISQINSYFILTNALVTLAVIIYCWQTEKTAFFYGQIVLLHGSINAAFVTADFISLYVALEVVGIAAFLLIAYPRTDKSLWIGLRYLFLSNVAMLFYLVGAVLVYKASLSFSFEGLKIAPPEALVLIFLGLLAKGGIFVSGLWLPLTHSESETPVSALMSGIVVKASVLPLILCANVSEEAGLIVRIFGVATSVLGVFYAVLEKDVKRMLAFHTISQLGFILASPAVGGFYALAHGLVKSSLFLSAGSLPIRNLKELQKQPINTRLWILLLLGSLSISGLPLFAGFGAKVLTLKELLPWQIIPMNIVAVGTVISFSKLILLPHQNHDTKTINSNLSFAVILLIVGLISANFIDLKVYTIDNIIKSIITIAIGLACYAFIFKNIVIKLPRILEEFDNLAGFMAVVSVIIYSLFFMVKIG